MQTDELQSFLAWLIQTEALLATTALIDLQNLPAKSALEKLKDHQIKGIKFGDRLFTKVREEIPPEAGKPRARRKRFVQRLETSPKIVSVLVGLGINQPILEKLAENPDPGAIQVDVEITYRSRSEKDGVAVLYALAQTVGKQDGLDTQITLSGNSSIKDDELTIRGPVVVQCPSGCIAMDDALSKLSKWLMDQIKSGRLA